MTIVMLLAVAAGLWSCAPNFTYVPIVSHPRQIDMAEAQRQMMSSSAQQSMIAWGCQSYVADAQIGKVLSLLLRNSHDGR